MATEIRVRSVFQSAGVPEITYVNRRDGEHERSLEDGIDDRNLCLLTGSSKTGKTTLYNQVLSRLGLVPLVVRCDQELTSDQFWKKALEQVNFSRLSASDTSVESRSKLNGG